MYCPEKNSSADGVAGRGEIVCCAAAVRRRVIGTERRGGVPRQAASGSVQSVVEAADIRLAEGKWFLGESSVRPRADVCALH